MPLFNQMELIIEGSTTLYFQHKEKTPEKQNDEFDIILLLDFFFFFFVHNF